MVAVHVFWVPCPNPTLGHVWYVLSTNNLLCKQVDYMLYFPLFFYYTKSKAQVMESMVSLHMLGVFNPLLGHRFHEQLNIGIWTHKLDANYIFYLL